MLGDSVHFFIHTDSPRGAFELAKPLLKSLQLLDVATAAYRAFSGETYKVIWPDDHEGTFVLY